ncbi:MAG: hypothetical protein GY710_08990 [Desulfobacteraceae bacterium]|nr:hypothetical protein [Desulfobacteraceae bacterium]
MGIFHGCRRAGRVIFEVVGFSYLKSTKGFIICAVVLGCFFTGICWADTDPHESFFSKKCLQANALPDGAPMLTITCDTEDTCYIYPQTVKAIADIESSTLRHGTVTILLNCERDGQSLKKFKDYHFGTQGLKLKSLRAVQPLPMDNGLSLMKGQ